MEAGHSWAVVLYFITSVPVVAYVLTWLHETINLSPVISGHWGNEVLYIISFLVFITYFLSAVFLSYWIFWYLIRFPVFNTIFSLTTLTHYYRRYHQPDTKLKDLVSNKSKNATSNGSITNRKVEIPPLEEKHNN